MKLNLKLIVGILSVAAYITTIFAANYAINKWGIVPVGFGLMAPAGVYFAGLAFTLRDMVQLTLGRSIVAAAILTGAACSYFVNPAFAFASAIAFLVSEFCDFAIFNTLLNKGKLFWGILLSGIVGLTVDSIIFLQLAFHSLDFLKGQIIGKSWILLVTLPLFFVMRWIVKNKIMRVDVEISTST